MADVFLMNYFSTYRMGIFSVLFVTFTVIIAVSASPLTQGQLDTLASSMSIKAKMLYNLRDNEKTHTFRIFVKNVGNTNIQASGWRLYFHSMFLIFPDVLPKNKSLELETEHVKVGMFQGDLYYLEPSIGFVEIQPNEEREYDITAAWWSISRTDFMPNWYVVSENDQVNPKVITTTENLELDYVEPFDDVRQWKRFAADRYNPYTAQERFRRYKVEDKGKIEKLVIPTPKHVEIKDEQTIANLDNTWKIFLAHQEYSSVADYIKEVLTLEHTADIQTENIIIINTTDTPSLPESYTLRIDPKNKRINLDSKDVDGMFYAAQSLRSILDGYNRTNIPEILIRDEPRFHYRGLHVDVARNFHPLSDIKRLMQAMAMYKMNKLHLHLSDDEGWRLEIPDIPELTEVGGQRCHDFHKGKCVIPQFGSGPFNTTSGTGYFSTEDYKEILKFAKKHHIQVIPEFDMPGHAHSAIVSMEERYRRYHDAGNDDEANKYRLSDPDDESEYISVQQWLDNAINPCVESVYTFIGKLMDEVIALHKDIQPLEIYNFGGDEVADHAWEESPKCKQFIDENPQYNVTKGVKIYFVKKVAELAAERNLSLAGWEDGFADGKHAPIVPDDLDTRENYAIPWNNIWEWGGGAQAYKLANAGYKVILGPATNVYFDHPQEPDPEERGLYWATRFTDTLKVFKFMPDSIYDNIFEERSGKPTSRLNVCGPNSEKCESLKKKENVLGMQGQMFSETIRTSENVDYMVFPRFLALAERAWYKASFEEESISGEEREKRQTLEWEAFANTLGYKELKRLDDMNISYRVPPPGARVAANGEVELSTTFPGLGVQHSNDSGKSWSDIPSGQMIQWKDGSTLHLRTVSANKKRHSRVIQVYKDEPQEWTDQSVIDYIADNAIVKVDVIDNLEKVDGYMLIQLQLINDGSMDIPGGTWRIYFYSLYGGKVETLGCGLKLEHANGGLFYFTPDVDEFTGIAAGETLTCQYYNKHWLISRTDNMPNWYVTSLGMKAKVIKSTVSESLDYVGKFDTPAKWKRTKDDQYDPYTPATRYDLYKMSHGTKKPYKITPTPFKTTINEEERVTFSTVDWAVVKSSEFPREAEHLANKLNISTVGTGLSRSITFIKGAPSENDTEAYDLDIDTKTSKVTITASSAAGAFYGAQTFISIVEGGDGYLAQMKISDKPRYAYRGVMPDISRNFKPKEWIFNFLDVMSMYKLNKLHFHLTDDEGWRVEIPEIPELTEVASKRCHSEYEGTCTIPQLGSGPDTSTSGSGYYTVEDYREILKYANDRHIEIIPEIETPGHASAVIDAMAYRETKILKLEQHGNKNLPESYLLSKHASKNEIFSPQKWTRNAIDPCLNTTYAFVETVIDSLIKLHREVQPLKVVHLGGDEVPSGVWNDSQACLDMLKPGQSIDTHQLKRMFSKRVADIVAAKGLTLASWDDAIYADDKPNPITDYESDVLVYTWNNRGKNAKKTSQFANAGYKVVLPLATHLYFDQPQEPDPEERGLYWATRFTDTEKVFGLMPDDIYANVDVDRFGNRIDIDELCEHKSCPEVNNTENILGIEACMFSETMRTKDQFHSMTFPRLLALAERAWYKASWEDIQDVDERNDERDKDWKEFSDNLGFKELSRLEDNDAYYRIPPPGARIEDEVLKVRTKYANLQVEISFDNGKTWKVYKETKLDAGSHNILLRAKSRTSNITSRHIEISTKIVSSATRLSSYLCIITFTALLRFLIS